MSNDLPDRLRAIAGYVDDWTVPINASADLNSAACELARMREKCNTAGQESFLVREYLDEAKDWLREILSKAEDCPNSIDEWRDGLCSASIESVINMCRVALSSLPDGVDVVYEVRRRVAQSVEQVAYNGQVPGSIPGATIESEE